jgi:hypothetical protein
VVCIESGSNHYFSHRNTKSYLLVRSFNEDIGTCQNGRLRVVTTVYDMGAKNVKALKLLGATIHKPYSNLQDQNIVTVYDPPHLLKCTRNLLLKYNVQFESELMGSQLSAVAR